MARGTQDIRIDLYHQSLEPQTWRIGDPTRYALPVRQIWTLINAHPWGARDPIHAYICSCFSELAYLHLTDRELDRPGRYKWVPSLAFQALARAHVSFNVMSAERLDFPTFVFATERFVYVGFEIGQMAIIAIRGTSTLADWGIDLTGWPVVDRAAGGRLHFGFSHEATVATPRLQQHLSKFTRTREVVFTGHSLGGAIAGTLHAQWPSTGGGRVTSLTPYVFGAPRYAESAVTSRSPLNAYRKPYDLVPHVPPRWFGYADTGDPAALVADRENSPIPSGWAVVADWLPRPGGPAFARQHAIELNRRRLGRDIAPDFPDLVYWEFAQGIMHSDPVATYPAPA